MGFNLRILLPFLLLSVPCLLFAQNPEAKVTPDSVLVKFERHLYSINPDKGDMIPVYFVQLDDLKMRLDTLEKYLTGTNLLDKQLEIRLLKANSYFDSTKSLVLDKMQRLDLVMYEEALKMRNIGDSVKANALFIRSLQHNFLYAPAVYELIKLNLVPDRAKFAVQYFENYSIPIDSSSNPYYYNLISSLKAQILDNIIASSSRMILQGLPSDALSILKEADYFNLVHPSANGKEKIKTAYTAAHSGMYHSLIIIADRAYSARKLDLSKYYYEKAQEYQKSHSEYLADNKASQQGLAKTISEEEKQFLIEKKPLKTRHYHKKRRPRTSSHHYTPTAKKIKLPPPVEIPKDTMADYQLRLAKTGKIIILDSVHSAYFLAWKNEIERAQNILVKAKQNQEQYFLQYDEEVNSAINELINRILERKCFSANSDYEASVYRALSQFIRSNYLEGKDFLLKAKLIYENNKDCGFSDSLLVKTQDQYKGLILWQEHWNVTKLALSAKDYQTFVDAYENSYSVYISEKLSNKGLIFNPLTKYLDNQKDMQLNKEIAKVFLNTGKLDQAWFLLQLLKNNDVKPAIAEDLLTEAGKKMAIKDIADGKNTWLEQLKSSGIWFKKAKKSYFRTIKSQPKLAP